MYRPLPDPFLLTGQRVIELETERHRQTKRQRGERETERGIGVQPRNILSHLGPQLVLSPDLSSAPSPLASFNWDPSRPEVYWCLKLPLRFLFHVP